MLRWDGGCVPLSYMRHFLRWCIKMLTATPAAWTRLQLSPFSHISALVRDVDRLQLAAARRPTRSTLAVRTWTCVLSTAVKNCMLCFVCDYETYARVLPPASCVCTHVCILVYVSRCMQTFYLVLLSFYSWEFNTLFFFFLKTLLVWCQFYQATKKMSRYFLQRLKGCSWKSSKYISKTTPKLHFAVENNICMHKSGQSHSLKKKQTSLTIWQVTVTWDTTKIKCFTESSLHIAVDWLG